MSHKLPLALIALAVITLVGRKQQVGVPNSTVRAATVQQVAVPGAHANGAFAC
jgi:hypothetical protein